MDLEGECGQPRPDPGAHGRRLSGARGRIADPDAPFVDRSVADIVMQYAWAHYAAAQAHAILGAEPEVERHIRAAEAWQRPLGE